MWWLGGWVLELTLLSDLWILQVKRILVKLDGRIVGSKDGILIRKGPGHCHFDFGQEISFMNPAKKPAEKQLNAATYV